MLTRIDTDDAIKYLAPSLEQHKGCTLIDIHPGACLWSSKLHEYLKPKRHLLMEPETMYYEPFIKPLLDAPGSTYRHTELSGAHPNRNWDSWKTIFEDPKFLPPCTLAPDDPKRRQFDPSVLVIGNLARRYRTHRRAISVHASLMYIQQMALSALDGELAHKNGIVRMLWWAPESETYLAFPPSETSRQKLNISLSMGSVMHMVFGVNHPDTLHQYGANRSLSMNLALASRVEHSMHERGMQRPEHREFLTQAGVNPLPSEPGSDVSKRDVDSAAEPIRVAAQAARAYRKRMQGQDSAAESKSAQKGRGKPPEEEFADEVLPSSRYLGPTQTAFEEVRRILKARELELVNPLIPTTSTLDELYAELDDAQTRFHSIMECEQTGPGRKVKKYQAEATLAQSLYFPQCGPLSEAYAYSKATLTAGAIKADMGLRVVKLEATYKQLEDAGEDKTRLPRLREAILRLSNEYEAYLATQYTLRDFPGLLIDSQIAFFTSPPLMPLDAREYEPLKAHSHEFWPRAELMLIDMMPKARDLSVPDLATRKDSVKIAAMLLKFMMQSRSQSLTASLDRVAPNATQDLIPQVPSITDPRQGGRLNPSHLRVRMITDRMIEGLVKAWAEWPFKPETTELELASTFLKPFEAEGATDPESVLGEE